MQVLFTITFGILLSFGLSWVTGKMNPLQWFVVYIVLTFVNRIARNTITIWNFRSNLQEKLAEHLPALDAVQFPVPTPVDLQSTRIDAWLTSVALESPSREISLMAAGMLTSNGTYRSLNKLLGNEHHQMIMRLLQVHREQHPNGWQPEV
jgi:hypothetical protein